MSVIDILVPVLSRPQNVKTFMESVKITSHDYRVFFVCSPSDKEEIKACKASGAEVLVVDWEPGRADFAKKINWAFPKTSAPWVFQAADDLHFHESWDIHAVHLGNQHEKGVVGTQDMGNELVKRGGHSTHTLIRREYIDTYGGTFDNSGLVFCELYDHQYCDNEFVQTAIRRGQWVFSKRSVVEHLHPAWGKSALDSTYDKATRATLQDSRLYFKRMKAPDRLQRKRKRADLVATSRAELLTKRRAELIARRKEAQELRRKRRTGER